MFIDNTYFHTDISLPLDSDLVDIQLTEFITKYEKEILIKILGYDLYSKFMEGLAVLPIENIEQKWIDLRDGSNFSYDGILYNWEGFQNPQKESLLAHAIYAKFIGNIETYITSSGAYQSIKDNSVKASSLPKIVKAYNNYISKVGSFSDKNRNNLYNFINVNNALSNDYETIQYKNLEYTNEFGI